MDFNDDNFTKNMPIYFYRIKPYCSIENIEQFIEKFLSNPEHSHHLCYLALPYHFLNKLSEKGYSSQVLLGMNALNSVVEGSFSGPIATRLLKEMGARFVLIGTADRRQNFGETEEVIAEKMKQIVEEHFIPVLCVGETLEQYNDGKTQEVLKEQITSAFSKLSMDDVLQILVVYEAPWIMSSSHMPNVNDIENAFKLVQSIIITLFGDEVLDKIKMLYTYPLDILGMGKVLEHFHSDGLYFDQSSLYTDLEHKDFLGFLTPITKKSAEPIQKNEKPKIVEAIVKDSEPKPLPIEEKKFIEEELQEEEDEIVEVEEESEQEESFVEEEEDLDDEEEFDEEELQEEEHLAETMIDESETEEPTEVHVSDITKIMK